MTQSEIDALMGQALALLAQAANASALRILRLERELDEVRKQLEAADNGWTIALDERDAAEAKVRALQAGATPAAPLPKYVPSFAVVGGPEQEP